MDQGPVDVQYSWRGSDCSRLMSMVSRVETLNVFTCLHIFTLFFCIILHLNMLNMLKAKRMNSVSLRRRLPDGSDHSTGSGLVTNWNQLKIKDRRNRLSRSWIIKTCGKWWQIDVKHGDEDGHVDDLRGAQLQRSEQQSFHCWEAWCNLAKAKAKN